MPTILRLHQKSTAAPKQHDPFYDSPAWRKTRKYKLSINPMCEYCEDKGFHIPAKIVDHYLPRALFPELSLELSNLKSCCEKCHNRKRNIEMRYRTRETVTAQLPLHGFYNKQGLTLKP